MFERALVVISSAAFLYKSSFFIKLARSRIGFPDLQDQGLGTLSHCPVHQIPQER